MKFYQFTLVILLMAGAIIVQTITGQPDFNDFLSMILTFVAGALTVKFKVGRVK